MEAETFADRFFGLRRLRPGSSLLIRTSSVHSWGMKRPFQVVGLDAELVVVARLEVEPGEVVRLPGCTAVIELPIDVTPPQIGAKLEVTVA